MIKQTLTALAITSALFLSVASVAHADYGCQPGYGNSQSCSNVKITINKTVLNPKTSHYVDNLTVSDPKYAPDQAVRYQITVTNTSANQINKAVIKDILPSFISFVSGSGTYDANARTFSYELTNLKAGESRTATFSAKVVASTSLPSDQTTICDVTNHAEVNVDGNIQQDNASLCIEKPVLGAQTPTSKGGLTIYPSPKVKKTPATGPEALSLLGLIPAAFIGLTFRSKATK